MDNTQVDQPSPPQSVHDSEDESLAGPQYASTEGEKLRDMEDFSSHQYATKALREAVLRSSRYFFNNAHELLAILKNEQVEVDENGPDGRTALSLAIENGLYDAVVLLLKKGADPNTREDQNRTPFFWAATQSQRASSFHYNYEDMIKSLLGAGADPSLPDDQGNTPLAVAAGGGNEEFVKLVVESGLAKINTQSDEEEHPLMRAAAGGWAKCMRYLLPQDADMGSCAWWERFLQTRSRQREKHPGQFQSPFPEPGLEDRAALGILTFQLKRNFLWNKVLPGGRTFLSWAVGFEDVEVVTRLLDSKADPNIRDETEHQMTPLLKALKIGSMAMVDLLKEKDKYSMHILVEEADDMGEEEALELARKLLREGYDLNRRNLKGQNPVHIACRKGKKRFVEEFLHPDYEDQNAFVHYQDNSGKTPLRYAIDNEDIVNLLVEHGADLSDVETASLFRLGEPKPLCVQLTNTRASNQSLLLISDYDEARELWSPELGVPQLR
jgi:ankyrin repeat protein